ncbi:MAG: esterase family protein [Lentisphaerae bacterium]|nr:esterase family protein [Lentisphaerota bacterium]MBT4819425.1 esterase family protein [Lentisphaerota bacterium]MBT5605188.1 esterase family protein [Lentisphaerota bacterium]MBT7054360.1 esterase family protein [Lentisphaerota bacterium]MBT7844856.1 esterase family protein [Lentisphaerota bacterium]
MAFAQVNWSSQTLGKQVGMHVILPEVGTPPFPVFYLLHGLSDDYTIWHRRTRIEWYVRERPLIVVMPDGFRGFYTNQEEGPAYASYMAKELPAFVERHFAASPAREQRCVGGLSMGGYGALRLALGYPERYVSTNSHSGAVLFGHLSCAELERDNAEFRQIFGADPKGSEHDLIALSRRAEQRQVIPEIHIDCGTEDVLIEQNREFHAQLDEMGVTHVYREHPGAHTWDYWDVHIQDALQFHCRALGI